MKKLLFSSTYFLIFIALFLMSCESKTEPINYGKDSCHFCKMTIMDAKYAAELVTKKGKVYKFDDISCMAKYLKMAEPNNESYAFKVVNNYEKPSEFMDVEVAVFAIGESFISPMRGDAAAFANKQALENYQKTDTTAKVITWENLTEKFD